MIIFGFVDIDSDLVRGLNSSFLYPKRVGSLQLVPVLCLVIAGVSSIMMSNETIHVGAKPSEQPANPKRVAPDSVSYSTSLPILPNLECSLTSNCLI